MQNTPLAVLFTLSAATCSVMVGLGIIWPLLPVLAVQFGAGGLVVGLIIASYNISRTLLSTWVGRFSDRLGRKNFILMGLALYSVVSFAYVMADSSEMLIAVRLAHGLASLLVVPICMALAGDIAPRGQLGSYLGTVNMALMAGLGLGPSLGGVLFEHFGMHSAFYGMGALSIFAGGLVLFLLPPDRESGAVVRAQGTASLREIFSDRTAVALVLMRFFAATGQGAVYTFLPIYAMGASLSSLQVGVLLSVNIFIVALMQQPVGRWMDRGNPKSAVLVGMFACAVSILPMPFVEGFGPLLGLNVLMGLASGLTFPGSLVISGHLGRTMGMASLMSVTDAAWTFGLIISPILSGLIMDTLGVAHVFTLGAALLFIGSVVVAVLLHGYEPPEDQGNIVQQ
ncbi:MFS transporter [Pseudodesulfovibrio portus]|uniref:MFS transporter n=1 Tax=Pseudodesulfovibrio portus TaxID=231439 RepID=A0ABM8AQG9_9BACT|nr:MFS transporter [Pseudodesulfovibrio portus]BDQ33661.1 MFS transporter [Pseudodesulfovibrio portus]